MKLRSRKRSALLALSLLPISLSLASVLWVRREQRQAALNRQLIEAITNSRPEQATAILLKGAEPKQVLALLEAGADPNSRYPPLEAPSVLQIMKLWLQPSSQSGGHTTALMLVCGAEWVPQFKGFNWVNIASPLLIKTMIQRGGNVNAKDAKSSTPLHFAALRTNDALSRQLLLHGADPNKADSTGQTPLTIAEGYPRPSLVAILRHAGKRP